MPKAATKSRPLSATTEAIAAEIGLPEPNDIIEWCLSDRWLNRPNLYPRQGTLLKLIFLQDDLFTQYDYDVIGEWSEGFKLGDIGPGETIGKYVGDWGVPPDVLERVRILKAQGRPYFQRVFFVGGRRGGKGHIGGICGSRVLWHFMAMGDPRSKFGVDRDKRLSCQVFAGKKLQARDNQWRDLVNMIMGGPCFAPWIESPLAESLTVRAPIDREREEEMLRRGVPRTQMDTASFEIVPKEATTMAARGPASFMQYYDEGAHMVATGVSRSMGEVWDAATPALDQFKGDAFIYSGSSPWTMDGKFYEEVQNTLSIEADTHEPVYPASLMIQLPSWDIYEDFERAHALVARVGWERPVPADEFGPVLDENDQPIIETAPTLVYNRLHTAIQVYDEAMQKLERANPDTFRVERRCLDPDTRVLTADLGWVRIDDLNVGDRLVAVDEMPPGDGAQRRMRTAEVKAKWDNTDDAYRITFTDGSSVVCSGTHRWLSTTPSNPGSYRWRSLYRADGTPGPKQSIKVGDSIAFMVDPWDEDRSWEAGYLAGVYDGEGTAIGYPRREFRVSFVQNPNEVLDATIAYLRSKGFHPRYMPKNNAEPGKYQAQAWVLQGFPEVVRFVGQIGGHKIRRQAIPGMWEGRGLGRVNGRSGHKVIASIEPVGERRLVDIETSTGTFVAEGFISHNSKWATAMDAYLPQEHVKRMFKGWPISTEPLTMQDRGSPTIDYVAHGDPGKTGSNFGFAMAHVVYVPDDVLPIPHVIFDVIKAWTPGDFPRQVNGETMFEMDYIAIEDEIGDLMDAFLPTDVSFDQWNSISMIQRLQKRSSAHYKRATVYERTATAPINWRTAETFKTALSLDRVHAPYHELAELECLFLRKLPGDKVDHPDTGPCTTKDVYDAMSIVVHKLIGQDVTAYIGQQLAGLQLGGTMPGMAANDPNRHVFDALSGFNAPSGGVGPARVSPNRSGAPVNNTGRLTRTPGTPRQPRSPARRR